MFQRVLLGLPALLPAEVLDVADECFVLVVGRGGLGYQFRVVCRVEDDVPESEDSEAGSGGAGKQDAGDNQLPA